MYNNDKEHKMANRNTNYYRKVGDGYVQHSADSKLVSLYETLRVIFKILILPIQIVCIIFWKFFKVIIIDNIK